MESLTEPYSSCRKAYDFSFLFFFSVEDLSGLLRSGKNKQYSIAIISNYDKYKLTLYASHKNFKIMIEITQKDWLQCLEAKYDERNIVLLKY